MKIAIECTSALLQKSLEIFLAPYLSSVNQSDIIIKDINCNGNKKCFYISTKDGADLIKPFSKSQLILALEDRYKFLKENQNDVQTLDFDILQKRIEALTQEYQNNILRAVKTFYEK